MTRFLSRTLQTLVAASATQRSGKSRFQIPQLARKYLETLSWGLSFCRDQAQCSHMVRTAHVCDSFRFRRWILLDLFGLRPQSQPHHVPERRNLTVALFSFLHVRGWLVSAELIHTRSSFSRLKQTPGTPGAMAACQHQAELLNSSTLCSSLRSIATARSSCIQVA